MYYTGRQPLKRLLKPMGSRAEELLQLSAKLFRTIPTQSTTKRTGERVLMESMQGPSLKSYWPNKVRDVVNFGIRPVSSEVPIDPLQASVHINRVAQSHTNLPVGLHHVYRENIAEWRRKRGGQIKKGTSSISLDRTKLFCRRCQGDFVKYGKAKINSNCIPL